jgi:hypothetical protein
MALVEWSGSPPLVGAGEGEWACGAGAAPDAARMRIAAAAPKDAWLRPRRLNPKEACTKVPGG